MNAKKMGAHRLSPSITTEDALIRELSSMISEITGVQLGEKQSHMVASRFHKHLIDLKVKSTASYVEYFNENSEKEIQGLVSLLTTHHTYFFREFPHFEFLRTTGLQNLVKAAKARGQKKIRFWSAACSRGHEVYSLATFLEVHLKQIDPTFGYEIVGSDIDPESVAIAANGVYNRKEVASIPSLYMNNFWVKGTGEIEEFVKIKNSIKANCHFRTDNLIQFLPDTSSLYDAIFCRNVFIYFNQDQITAITSKFLKSMYDTGYLFVGISESLHGNNLEIKNIGTSIYTHKKAEAAAPAATASAGAKAAPAAAPFVEKAKNLRVLCVDDSPTVHTLLKQILKPEFGFEIVGKAMNGLEAAEFLKKEKVDLVTLDIHMPGQTGIEYLEKNFKRGHAPVVMISSVSRDNADLAMRALKLGASDYIEKPALNKLEEQSEQIRTKLLCAHLAQNANAGKVSQLDQQFKKSIVIPNPDQCFRLVMAGPGDRTKLEFLVRELKGGEPASIILVQGMEAVLPALAKDLSSLTGRNIELAENDINSLAANHIYLADFDKMYAKLKTQFGKRRTSILIYGRYSDPTMRKLAEWSPAQILVEDLGAKNEKLKINVTDVVPGTSFGYMSSEYLGSKNG